MGSIAVLSRLSGFPVPFRFLWLPVFAYQQDASFAGRWPASGPSPICSCSMSACRAARPGLLGTDFAAGGVPVPSSLVRCSHRVAIWSLTTSPPSSSQQSPPRAIAQEAGSDSRPQTPSSPRSPALSTASTADAGPSPALPALPAPRLPDNVLALLRTPPSADHVVDDNEGESRFVTASWGSPYPQSDTSHLRLSSLSSEPSEDSPIHNLEIHTPFLRPAPFFPDLDEELAQEEHSSGSQTESLSSPSISVHPSSSLVSAAVLANRARRPARGLTEDWIRQHTTGDFGSEARLWLSDNSAEDSENSSLSGSVSGIEQGNEDERSLRTPRAVPLPSGPDCPPRSRISSQRIPRKHTHHPRHRSSLETVREADLNRLSGRSRTQSSRAASAATAMDSSTGFDKAETGTGENATGGSAAAAAAVAADAPAAPATPVAAKLAAALVPEAVPLPPPTTPPQRESPSSRRDNGAQLGASLDPLGELTVSQMTHSPKKTPRRVKKKLPWKGKSILVLLPFDEHRGKPGKPPLPLSQKAVDNMLRSWEELGYDIDGFDLDRSAVPDDPGSYGVSSRSMSRTSWPDEDDIARERALRRYPVLLPDLNAWKNYVEELNEAKLRALGVSFADEEPPLPPSISPGVGPGASISRQSSATVYPPLPFSPPIPTSSASSNHGPPPFSFPAAFVPGAAAVAGSSAAQSPSIPSAVSPIPFGGGAKFNARQSISIPAGVFQMPPLQQTTPGGFSPQALLLQQGLARGGSPSLAALSSVMSPTSPFTPDGGFTSPPLHQRHQSLQYPLVQYPQLQTSARASPRLHDLREVEEEAEEKAASKSPSKTPEPASTRPFVQHNASLSLQKEIDDAEYHLEEQFRSQFEHDRDYSPHGGRDPGDGFDVGPNEKPIVPQHARGLSVQFAPAPPIQRFRDDAENGPPLHHPRPHSRGHSLANTYFVDPDEARSATGTGGFAKAASLAPAAAQNKAANGTEADDTYEIETNPSNLGTPIQGLDLASVLQQQQDQQKQQHQRSFSTASNPWSETGSFSGKQSATRRPSHGSKASLSNLNVEAPEFKFNPAGASAFQPSLGGQFFFGSGGATSEAARPSIFQAGLAPNAPPSANSSQFSFPTTATTSSKINVNAPAFSPGQSEFSFSAVGPKFRPDAPSFTPFHSLSDSLTSPVQSGSESATGGNRTSSIFGNIDLNIPDVVKPAKRSKAVPIVRPASRHSPKPAGGADDKENELQHNRDDQVIDDSRFKRVRAATNDDGNDEVLFAEPSKDSLAAPSPLTTSEADTKPGLVDAGVVEDMAENKPGDQLEHASGQLGEKPEDGAELSTPQPKAEALGAETAPFTTEKDQDEEGESALAAEDTTLSSTVMSVSTDAAKVPATTSPSELSPQGSIPWAPFEFRSDVDVADFNSARPMGDDVFRHKKSLSATAKPFTPGANFQGSVANEVTDHDSAAEDAILSTEIAEEKEQAGFEPSPVSSEGPSLAQAPELAQSSSPPPPPPAAEKPKGLAASRYAMPFPPSPPPKAAGLSGSRYATSSPPPVPSKDTEHTKDVGDVEDVEQPSDQQLVMPVPEADLHTADRTHETPSGKAAGGEHVPTFEEIDDIMLYLNENDPAQGVNKTIDSATWHRPASTSNHIPLAAAASESPLHLPAPSPSRSYHQLTAGQSHEPLLSTELEDPFVDPPLSAAPSFDTRGLLRHGNASGGSMPPSEWEEDFTGDEQLKLESRVNFFDGRVNDIVGGILAARLGPVEKSLDRIQHALVSMSRGTPSSRRERRSNSGEIQESDADDEDDEVPPVPRRSMSPRRDRRMDQMRAVVLEALTTHQREAAPSSAAPAPASLSDDSMAIILKSLDDVKEQFGQSLRLDFRGEDLRNIVEDAVERRLPLTPQPSEVARETKDAESQKNMEALQARIAELEERLQNEQMKADSEISDRRLAEDQTAELHRKLELAETKIEVEIMNRSAYDQRVADLEDRLKHQEEKNEAELAEKRAAEDRLAEVQRLLRIASEEEMRLREAVDERDEKLKTIDKRSETDKMRLAVLEASQVNGEKTHSDLQNRLNAAEAELREKAQEARHWRDEAERAIDLSQRQGNDLVQTATELKHLKKVVDTLGTQLEENERLRETWRTKFVALQDDMARAARDVAEESARHIKREEMLVARMEVLDAKLQAEARTRERLESELERLEGGERQAMRAVAESKRLETLFDELRAENQKLQQSSLRYQAEFEEARESAAREVQRTRDAMQAEVDEANHQVNVVRGELEDQMARVRGQLDQVKLDSDTSKARLEMLLEEAETTKRTALDEAETSKQSALDELKRRHQNEVEDLLARYERQINNAAEDAQRSEENLLERLSISTSKTEHLQDRVAHLEEKLEIAREAAQAAAKAAKATSAVDVREPSTAMASTSTASSLQPAAPLKTAAHHGLGLPEKISPQALRESILVLQEQLQQREQRIEELEHTLAKVDPEADVKIAKRDDEIIWLRELLDVRHSDLKDIIAALGRDDHDPDRVRDAVIRLQANLQMEEQERERAMNGGSAIKLPSIAASIRDAATPRVAQAVGPLAAAWGNWRKTRDSNASNMAGASGSFNSLSGVLLSSPAPSSASRRGGASASLAATPSRGTSSSTLSRPGGVSAPTSGDSSFLSGLLTPPTSGMRQTPPTRQSQQQDQEQPTAFSSTGRRYTGEQTPGKRVSRAETKLDGRGVATTPPPNFRRASRGHPVTPPIMRTSAYDSDANAEEFDDAAFFDD